MPSPAISTPRQIRSALMIARSGDRDACLRALLRLRLASGPGASIDHIWLAAELEYLLGHYPKALELFAQFDRDPRSRAVPTWQRYRSSHHQSFAALQTADYARSADCLADARRRAQASGELERYEGDLEAMEASLLEVQGKLESARLRFELAYKSALKAKQWHRAATTAADVARIIVGHKDAIADASPWLERARKAASRTRNALIRRTIDIREAGLLKAAGKLPQALRIHNRIIQEEIGRASCRERV